MAGGIAKDTKDILEYEKGIARTTVSYGMIERAQLKWTKIMHNIPIVKQFKQIKQLVGGFKSARLAVKLKAQGDMKGAAAAEKQTTKMQMLIAGMTMFGGATKTAGKATSGLSKAMMGIVSTALFLTGIFLIIGLAVAVFAAIFADASSPLTQWLTDMPVLGELLGGLQILLTGEDGESGLGGAFNVLAVAVIAGGIAFLLFGAPVAVVVATIIGVIGIFRWAKAKTGSIVIALLAAGAVLMVGVGALIVMFTSIGTMAVAAVMAPIILIMSGLALAWAVMTGKASSWWSILAAAIIVIGIALLISATTFISFVALLPFMLIAAPFIIAFILIYKYWDQIKAFFIAAWDYLAGIFTSIGDGIMAGVDWYIGMLVAGWNMVMDFIMAIPGFFSSVIDGIVGIWDGFWALIGGWGNAIGKWFSGVGDGIATKWNGFLTAIKALPGTVKTIFMNGIKSVASGIAGVWNSYIAHTIPRISIPDWVPGLGGKKWGPKPEKMVAYAEGGIVSSPTLGMVGEAGAEAIIPLKGGNVPVRLSGAQYSDATMRRMIAGLAEVIKQSGNTFNITVNPSGIIADSEKAKAKFAEEMSEIIAKNIQKQMIGNMHNPMKTIGAWF
jgi:hypothetical protein